MSLLLSFTCILFVPQTLNANKHILEVRTIAITPYGFERALEPNGIYFDLASQLIKNAGFSGNNLIYPYARIVNEIKSGKTDLTVMFKYKELDEHVIYIAPLPTLKNVVVGLAKTKLHTISDLKGKGLGYLRGAKFSDIIDNAPKINNY